MLLAFLLFLNFWNCRFSTSLLFDSLGMETVGSYFTENNYDTLITCTDFEKQKQTGVVQDKSIPELSGIAASRKNKGGYWVHNDSGNPNDIFLIDSLGNTLLTVRIGNAYNRDWEDICVGAGPDSTKTYVYVGEIGDNNTKYPIKAIYRIEEPTIQDGVSRIMVDADIIYFNYPDEKIYNAETLMLDPKTKDLFIVTKGDSSQVFILPYPQIANKTTTVKYITSLPIYLATAGDISPKGDEILIKNYTQIFYWKRFLNEDIQAMLKRKPLLIPYTPEVQGEAIGWNYNATGFLTSTEIAAANEQKIFYYKRK